MRITYVKKSRIDQGHCSKCRDPLPKGSAYRWIKFLYGSKSKRCMKSTCAFRPSDMTSSDKLADLYSAQEQAQDALGAVRTFAPDGDLEATTAVMSDLAETLREGSYSAQDVGDRYQESADNMAEYFDGSPQIDEIEQKSEAAIEWAGELEEAAGLADEPLDEDTDIESVLSEIEDKVEALEVF